MNECCMRAYIYVYHMYVEYSCTYIVDATPNACPAHMLRLRHIHITNVEFRSLPRNRIWQHMLTKMHNMQENNIKPVLCHI